MSLLRDDFARILRAAGLGTVDVAGAGFLGEL